MPCTQPTRFEAWHPLAKQTFYFLSLLLSVAPCTWWGTGLALVLTFSGQTVKHLLKPFSQGQDPAGCVHRGLWDPQLVTAVEQYFLGAEIQTPRSPAGELSGRQSALVLIVPAWRSADFCFGTPHRNPRTPRHVLLSKHLQKQPQTGGRTVMPNVLPRE